MADVKCTPNVRHYDKIVNNTKGCIFMSRKNKQYSGEFKQAVVEDMRVNSLSQNETALKYKVVIGNVQLWERIYLEEGSDGLYIERRGRASNLDGVRNGRPRRLEKKVEEDLIAENQRLRMEVDYLKKLNALVHQKEISERKTKHK